VEAGLFAAAQGVQRPWYVSGLDFSLGKKRLDIRIDFEAGGSCRVLSVGCHQRPMTAPLSVGDIWTSFSMKHISTPES